MAAASAEGRGAAAVASSQCSWHCFTKIILLLCCVVVMFSFMFFRRRRWSRSRKLAEKYLEHARLLVQSQEPSDVYAATGLLDGALKLHPQWEKALELKARCLLSLRRFREVANLLYDYIPSLKYEENEAPDSPPAEKVKLLPGYGPGKEAKKKSLLQFLSFTSLKKKLQAGLSRKAEREEWRFLVLGQACCHLGMLEDSMILLQSGKRAASAALRRESNMMDEDTFCYENGVGPSESDLVSHLLANIKFLLRRRAAGLAAMEAGLFAEAVRHFSKILDGRRGTPQGFIAECYFHRAVAYQGAGRIPDAIADCNRTLALDPACLEALCTRAALYEMVRCFYECFHDLEQLKLLYEAIIRHRKLPGPVWRLTQSSEEVDVHANYLALNDKINEIRRRLENGYSIDYHAILGVSHKCKRSEVERAHLLICLKHRPDKAAHFVDRCEFVDDRDIEAVKEEARVAAIKLFCLIQRAHSGVIGLILDEEVSEMDKRAVAAKDEENLWPDEQPADVHSLLSLQSLVLDSQANPCLGVENQIMSTGQTTDVIPEIHSTADAANHPISVIQSTGTRDHRGQQLNCNNDVHASIPSSPCGLCEFLSKEIVSERDCQLSTLKASIEESVLKHRQEHRLGPASAGPPSALPVAPSSGEASVDNSVFSRREDGLSEADAATSVGAGTCRELAINLSSAFTSGTWMSSSDNWGYQGYGTISLQV